MDVKPPVTSAVDRGGSGGGGGGRGQVKGAGLDPATGKKTKGRVKIKMEFIDNKLRRYTTFSKRKTGIMKKAYELSTLTGTQVMLLVASETGHVYTFATRKLQPMITSDAGKALIQTCLNSPDPPPSVATSDQRMSATGYEETELTYNIADDEQQKVRQMMYNSHYSAAAAATASAAVVAAQHSHNLFPPTSGGVHMNASMPSHSPYGVHPVPSPSPSHHGSYTGVSLSPGPTHHSPPFVPPLSQHSR
jgi:serum response factor